MYKIIGGMLHRDGMYVFCPFVFQRDQTNPTELKPCGNWCALFDVQERQPTIVLHCSGTAYYSLDTTNDTNP